jgi:integrase
MSRKTSNKPPRILKVRQDRDYDCVYIGKKKIMLGRTGTPEADAAFRKLQIQILTDPTFASLKPEQVTVDNLCLAYLKYAKETDPDHFFGIKTAVEILLKQFTGQTVDVLDTRHFLVLQDLFVQHGVSRQYCNTLMNYVRAMLKWGILRKLVPHQVYVEAKFIPPLRKGKTRAYEKPPRQDVPDEVINRTLPHLLPTIRDMVQVQLWASMRPSEVFRMKPGEIDTEYKTDDGVVIWMYAPGVHKSTWRAKNKAGEYFRIIPLGKPEQDILAPRLVGKADTDYIFSPKDTVKERIERDATKRKSKMQPSQVKRKEQSAKKPKRRDRDSYDRNSYNRAIQRSIVAANKHLPDDEQIPAWSPYQLRHAAITDIVQQTGSLDTARAVAGQKSISVTQGYNHADVKIAIEQAVKRSQ